MTGTREELYNEIEKGAKLDGNYLLLVFLSTIVATIGLVENNVAVIIGAMVIAPLLGPNIALAFSTSLGDTRLMLRAAQLYYHADMTQDAIGKRLGVSRFKVGRLLDRAVREQAVRFEIVHPAARLVALED